MDLMGQDTLLGTSHTLFPAIIGNFPLYQQFPNILRTTLMAKEF